MNFNDQIAKIKTEGNFSSVFKPGVKVKTMSGKGAIIFRILPAFDMEKTIESDGQTYVDPMGWLPFRLSDGSFTNWASIAYIARFVGYGTYKTNTRKDIVAWSTFDPDLDASCPYMTIYRRASQDPDFRSLMEDIKDSAGKVIHRAALTKPAMNMITNIIDINDSAKGVQLGLFSTSAAKALIGADGGGLANQKNINVTDEQLAQNYLTRWAVVDLTHPTNGPVLVCVRGTDKGEMSGYNIELAFDSTERVRRWDINPPELLAHRQNLADIESYIKKQETEDVVKTLVQVLNIRLPNGYHAYALLKEIFGGIYGNLIPNPPSSPAAAPVVNGVEIPSKQIALATGIPLIKSVAKPTMTKPATNAVIQENPVTITAQVSHTEEASSNESPAESSASQAATTPPPMVPGVSGANAFDRDSFIAKITGAK